MQEVNLNIYKSIQKSKKLSEQYIGSFPIVWWYAVGLYKADCTEAIPFTPFDNVICGLLSIENSLSFYEIAEILGLNVIDNPDNNQYKDFAEEEILKEALQSLYEYEMIEIGDTFYSNCYLTELGKEYTAKGKKFKTTENKSFKLFFDCFTNQHNKAKQIFEDLKGNNFNFPTEIEFENESYVKSFAESQIPEIYDTKKGNSFTNSELIKIDKFSIHLYACLLYDLQTEEYKYKVFNPQTKSINQYFSEEILNNIVLQNTIIENITKELHQTNEIILQEQISYENQLVTVQNEIEVYLHENKQNEAEELYKSTIKNLEYIDIELFWLNLTDLVTNDCIEFWLNVSTDNIHIFKSVKKLLNHSFKHTKFYISLNEIENEEIENELLELSINSNSIYLIFNKNGKEFSCYLIKPENKQEIFTSNYIFEYNSIKVKREIYKKTKFSELSENKYVAQKQYFTNELLPGIIESIYDKINIPTQNINKQFIVEIENSDIKISDLYNFANDIIKSDLENLAISKSQKLTELKNEYKLILSEKITSLKQTIEAEKIENLKKISDYKNQLKGLENELFEEYSDLANELLIIRRKLSEIEFYIKDQLLAKTFIIDTNIFIEEPEIIDKIEKKHKIILSAKVIDELDNLKRNRNTKVNAGKALKILNQNLGKNKRLKTARANFKLLPKDFDDHSPDNMILAVALMYKKNNPVLLTNDNGLQVKAKISDIPTISLTQFFKPEHEKTLNLPINLKTNTALDLDLLIKAIQNSWNVKTESFELSSLNNTLKVEIPNFNFRDYGYEKFKDFCLSLSDIFELETKENGTAVIIPKLEIKPIKQRDSLEYPIDLVKRAFQNTFKRYGGKVDSKQLYFAIKKIKGNFRQEDYGFRKFKQFYLASNLFDVIEDGNFKFLKLKENVKI